MAHGDTIERDGATYVDLTPTPEEYRNTLRYIIRGSINSEHRLWAAGELERIVGVTEWGPQGAKDQG